MEDFRCFGFCVEESFDVEGRAVHHGGVDRIEWSVSCHGCPGFQDCRTRKSEVDVV